ncbi:sugar phosphate isomerase/epimerase [soil metagenome]
MTAAVSGRLPIEVACHANALVAEATLSTLPAVLDSIAKSGYSHIVLPPTDPASIDVGALRRLLASRDIAAITMVGGLTPETDVGSPDPSVRAAGAEVLRSVIDFTAELGGDQVNGVSYGGFGHPAAASDADTFERAAIEVGAAADYAHSLGIAMTFEVLNRYETSLINTCAQALEFVRASGSKNLRIHLDTFHMAIEEADMAEAIRTALPTLGYLELGQSGRGPLSTGVVDVPEIVRLALDAGYTGRFGVEAFSRSLLPPGLDAILAIWRSPYTSGADLAADAAAVIRDGAARAGR